MKRIAFARASSAVLLVIAIAACGCKPQSDDGDAVAEGGADAVSVSDNGSGLTITNNSADAYTVRVAFVVPGEQAGIVTACNPYGTVSNRKEVPLPEAPFSEFDRPLAPGGRLDVPQGVCPSYVGYSVWVRDVNGNVVHEEHT